MGQVPGTNGIKRLWNAPCAVEPTVDTPAELACRRELPFMGRILPEGKVLHDRGKAET
jgi:hypothetical protein